MSRNLIAVAVAGMLVVSALTDTLRYTFVVAMNLAILSGIWWAGRSAWRWMRG